MNFSFIYIVRETASELTTDPSARVHKLSLIPHVHSTSGSKCLSLRPNICPTMLMAVALPEYLKANKNR